jgi:tRNA nucleotidyltransferase/poly(A) polymerase
MIDQVIEFVRLEGRTAWLVGGYVRDRLLGRPTHDLDIIVPEGGVRLARRLSDTFAGASFILDADRDVGRAIIPSADTVPLDVDVARLRAPDLIDDLSLRDFTVNAMAMDLTRADLAMFDPFDGRADLDRNLLRAVTEGAFVDDPLRTLRGVRMVAEMGFRIEDATFNLMRRDAYLLPSAAPERIREELMRIVVAPAGWQHLRLLCDLDLLQRVLPESAAQAGVSQSAPHYQDVFDHSRSVLAHLAGIYALIWPDGPYAIPQPDGDPTVMADAGQWAGVAELLAPYQRELQEHLRLPLAAGRTRRDLLCWAAIAHDWGKPAKRTVEESGRVRFFDHDHWGALLVEARLGALKFSGDEIAYVARITDLHMRPGELAHEYPFSRRAEYHFFRDADNTAPDVVLLSLADHMATHAPAPEAGRWETRLKTSAGLLESFFRAHTQRVAPAPLVNGHQVMAELGLPAGPRIGQLLEGLREAQATGEVRSPADAWEWLRSQER